MACGRQALRFCALEAGRAGWVKFMSRCNLTAQRNPIKSLSLSLARSLSFCLYLYPHHYHYLCLSPSLPLALAHLGRQSTHWSKTGLLGKARSGWPRCILSMGAGST